MSPPSFRTPSTATRSTCPASPTRHCRPMATCRSTAHVRALVAVAQAIGDPVHLVGNSLGGSHRGQAGRRTSRAGRSLTLISPALPDLRPRFGSAQLTVALTAGRSARLIVRACPPRRPRVDGQAHLRALLRQPEGGHRRAARARTRHAASAGRASSTARGSTGRRCAPPSSAYLDRSPRRLWRQAAAVGVPTLVHLWRARSAGRAAGCGRRAKRTFPDAELLALPDIGHVAHLEDPTAVAARHAGIPRRGPSLIRGMSERRGTVVDVTSL